MHEQPPLKLNRNQRELMRSMMEEDVRTLLRPHIDRRLQQLELTDHAAILVNLLEQEAHSDEEQFFANVTRGTVRKLNPVLARLPLLALAARLGTSTLFLLRIVLRFAGCFSLIGYLKSV